MAVYTGKVENGRVTVDGVLFEEGATVVVLVPGPDDDFELTPDLVAEFQESIIQAVRGETISADALIAEMRARSRAMRAEAHA